MNYYSYLCTKKISYTLIMDARKVIKGHGWTIKDLAAKMKRTKDSVVNGKVVSKKGDIGISPEALTQMLNGSLTIERVNEIAEIIGCSPCEFVTDDTPDNITAICPHCGKPIHVNIT